jgi:hypothetical protein
VAYDLTYPVNGCAGFTHAINLKQAIMNFNRSNHA